MPVQRWLKFFANRVPSQSHELVRLYEAAGLIVLGKSNLPDMSLIPSTEGGVYGDCRNPWNLDDSAGGSSGGAGASVSAGHPRFTCLRFLDDVVKGALVHWHDA
ncbi:MAG: hypothetical protein GY869_10040 [Planctomycetes bacterium]|nr:hypothetical protein [Planctomycetota bacterium]